VLVSVLHQALLGALREAGSDGLGEGEMGVHGGRWWSRHVRDINRWKLATIGEHGGRYFLVAEPSASTEPLSNGEQPPSRDVGLSRLREDQTGDSASVDAELTLFPSCSSHYREAA
jgi:hypothetical protein